MKRAAYSLTFQSHKFPKKMVSTASCVDKQTFNTITTSIVLSWMVFTMQDINASKMMLLWVSTRNWNQCRPHVHQGRDLIRSWMDNMLERRMLTQFWIRANIWTIAFANNLIWIGTILRRKRYMHQITRFTRVISIRLYSQTNLASICNPTISWRRSVRTSTQY
jgi:hypothetical protein